MVTWFPSNAVSAALIRCATLTINSLLLLLLIVRVLSYCCIAPEETKEISVVVEATLRVYCALFIVRSKGEITTASEATHTCRTQPHETQCKVCGHQFRVIPLAHQALKAHLWEERVMDTSFGARQTSVGYPSTWRQPSSVRLKTTILHGE